MSKKRATSTAQQLIPGDDALRQAITEVRFVVDHRGDSQTQLAVRLKKAWHLVDGGELAEHRIKQLAQLALASGIPLTGGLANRKLLCDELLAAPRGSLVVLEPDTYQTVCCGGNVYRAFVWRGQVHWVGDVPDEPHHVKPGTLQDHGIKGTLEEWKEYAACFTGNPYLIVGVGAALSALLVKPLGVDSLSLFYVGRTSIGKSAIQAAVKSLIRQPTLDSASGTMLGLQQTLSGLAGQPVFLEDLRQQRDVAGLVDLVFDIGNRAARQVGHASQSSVRGRAMECVLLASNERTLGELLGGKSYDGGVEARLLELDIDAPHGAFHELPDGMDGAGFADYLRDGAQRFHGTAWGEWVECAASNLDKFAKLWSQRKVRLQQSLHDEDQVDGAIRRALQGVAFWKFCLLMAARHEIVPLEKDDIDSSFRMVVEEHLRQRQKGMTRKGEYIVAQLRTLVDQQPQKFPQLSQAALRKNHVLGFRKTLTIEGGEVETYLFRKRELLAALGEGEKEVEHALEAAGFLIRQKDGSNKMVKLPDGRAQRMLAVRASFLSDD